MFSAVPSLCAGLLMRSAGRFMVLLSARGGKGDSECLGAACLSLFSGSSLFNYMELEQLDSKTKHMG